MALYVVIVPIRNPYTAQFQIFEQYLYFEGVRSPRQQDVIAFIEQLHERDKQFLEYDDSWNLVLESVKSAKDFPILGGRLVESNTFVNLNGVEHPLTVKRIMDIQQLSLEIQEQENMA